MIDPVRRATDGSCASTGVSAFSSRSPAGRGWRASTDLPRRLLRVPAARPALGRQLLDQGRLARRDDAPDTPDWQGAVPGEYLDAWGELGGGPQLSTALKIRLDLDDIAATAFVPGQVHELTYEALITEPEPTLRELCWFAGPVDAGVRAGVARDRVLRLDHDPAKHLTDAEGDRVLEFMQRTERSVV